MISLDKKQKFNHESRTQHFLMRTTAYSNRVGLTIHEGW